MLDLVFNHTAIDSPSPCSTVTGSPWTRTAASRTLAIDPADTTKITVWGDLAELEYWPPPDPEGLRHFWDQVIPYYLRLGFTGFRADAAYKVPATSGACSSARPGPYFPEVRFFAETLGCRLSELGQLRRPASTLSTTAPSGGILKRTGAWTSTTAFATSPPPSASPSPTTPTGWPRSPAAAPKWPGSATSSRRFSPPAS